MQDYFCYILISLKDGRFYIGQTNNLENRLKQHNQGKSNYTKRFIPWKLFAFIKVDSRNKAMDFERKIKNLKSRNRILIFIEKNNFKIVKGAEK
jgi:putative endonuclease